MTITLRILLFICLLFLGGLAGCASGKLRENGAFESWVPLGSPPGGGVDILDADGGRVIVQSANGQAYACSILQDQPCWEPVAWPPQEEGAREVVTAGRFWILNTPQNSIDSITVIAYPRGEDYVEAKFVLLEDGSVQGWQHRVSFMSYVRIYTRFLLIGLSIGLILGILVIIVPYPSKPAGVTETSYD